MTVLTMIAMVATMPAAAQSSSQSTAAANAASAASLPPVPQAAPVAAAPPSDSPADAKARAKAKKAADKAAEKARRDAERANRPKSNTGAKVGGCVAGAALAVGLSLLLGGKSAAAVVGSAVVGCVGGWKLGAALKGNDDKKLSGYLSEDYVDRDDLNQTVWHAPESGADIKVENVGESYQVAKQTVTADETMDFDQTNIKVATRKMRTTAPVKLRSSMDQTGEGNVVGRYDANEIVQVYGDSTDGKWVYLGERQADGGFVLIGYVQSASLSTSLDIPTGQAIAVAKPKPKQVAVVKAPVRKKGKATAKAAPEPVPTPAPIAKPSVAKTYNFSAPTRCKSMKLSALGKTDTKPVCGGAKSIA